MSKTFSEPFAPESLQPLVTDDILATWQELASQPAADFMAQMGDVQHPGVGKTAYVDLTPAEDYDETMAVLLPLPFANGYAPHMAYRAHALLATLRHQRVIVFPNNTMTDKKAYSLTDGPSDTANLRAIKQVEQGDFGPIADRQFRTLDDLGVKEFQVVGYSQGATIGAAALRRAAETGYFGVKASGLFETPNAVQRSPQQLSKDFQAGGMGAMRLAMNQSAISGLSASTHADTDSGLLRQALDVAWFGLGVIAPITGNAILRTGLEKATFIDDVETALLQDPALQLLIVRAAASRTMPARALADIQARFSSEPRVTTRQVEGYGHEMGDNVFVHTLLARAALQPIV